MFAAKRPLRQPLAAECWTSPRINIESISPLPWSPCPSCALDSLILLRPTWHCMAPWRGPRSALCPSPLLLRSVERGLSSAQGSCTYRQRKGKEQSERTYSALSHAGSVKASFSRIAASGSLELHVEGVAAKVLVELAELEELGRIADVLLSVVAAHATTRPTRARHAILHHLPLFRTLQYANLSPLLCGFAVRCHGQGSLPSCRPCRHLSAMAHCQRPSHSSSGPDRFPTQLRTARAKLAPASTAAASAEVAPGASPHLSDCVAFARQLVGEREATWKTPPSSNSVCS